MKPSGTIIDPKEAAADRSIEVGNLSPLENLVEKDKIPELKETFEKVMSLKNFDVNNVQAGREYVEAYVGFIHFAAGGSITISAEQNNNEVYVHTIDTGVGISSEELNKV